MDRLSSGDIDRFMNEHAAEQDSGPVIDSVADEDHYSTVIDETYVDTRELQAVYSETDGVLGGTKITTFLKSDEQYCRYERIIGKSENIPDFITPWNWESWMQPYVHPVISNVSGVLIPVLIMVSLLFWLFLIPALANGERLLVVIAGALSSSLTAAGLSRYCHWRIRRGLSGEGVVVLSKDCELLSKSDYREYLAEHDRGAYREQFGKLPRP